MLSSLWVTSSLGIWWRQGETQPHPELHQWLLFRVLWPDSTGPPLARCVLEGGAGPLGALPSNDPKKDIRVIAFHDNDIRDSVVPVEKAAFFPLCRGPAPVDPGNSKGGRRWRGKTCLLIDIRLD